MQHTLPEAAPQVCTADLIGAALQKVPQLKTRAIDWQVQEGMLVLRGRVTSFYQKQAAQLAVLRLPGITRIVNELDVDAGGPGPVSRNCDHRS